MAYDKTKIEWLTPASSGLVSDAPVVTLSASDKTKIEGYLDSLYTTSLGSDLLDRATAGAAMLKIGGAATGDIAYASKGGVGAGYIAINVSDIDKLYVINEVGELIKCDPRLSLIHELGHAIDIRSDPTSFSDADLQGTAVAFQNAVAEELGLSAQKQVSYSGQVVDSDGRFGDLNTGASLTNGQIIKNALLGRNSVNDVIDLSGRAAEADLVFGFDGNDLIKTGGGNDFVYGGGGSDTLDGGAGNDSIRAGIGADSIVGADGSDTIYGEDGNDTIDGGAGADHLFGGAGDDRIIATGASSVIDGGDDDDVVTVASGQALQATLGAAIAGGTAILNVESIIGGELADKFNVSGFGSSVIVDGKGSTAATDYFDAIVDGDEFSYAGLSSGIAISIGAGGSISGAGYDVTDVERLIGTDYADTITASGHGGAAWDAEDVFLTLNGVHTIRAGGGNDYVDLSAMGEDFILVYGENDGQDVVVKPDGAIVFHWFKDIESSQLVVSFLQTGATQEEWIDLNPDYWERYTPGDWYIGVAGGSTKVLIGPGGRGESYQDPGNYQTYGIETYSFIGVDWDAVTYT